VAALFWACRPGSAVPVARGDLRAGRAIETEGPFK
jgi:hypothetical protein